MKSKTVLTAKRNKNGGQKNLDENRVHFSQQAEKILKYLLRGYSITGLKAFKIFGIQDYRPRIAAIKKHVQLESTMVKNGKGAKQWRIAPDKLSEAKEKFNYLTAKKK